MTEAEYIEKLWDQWPNGKPVDIPLIMFARKAIHEYPLSAALKCMLGDLLQLSGQLGDSAYDTEVRALYIEAHLLDDTSPEPLECLGWFADSKLEDMPLARWAFEQAIARGAEESSYAGLARVLAQLGHQAQALQLLETGSCPFADNKEVNKMRQEIANGEWTLRDEAEEGQ